MATEELEVNTLPVLALERKIADAQSPYDWLETTMCHSLHLYYS